LRKAQISKLHEAAKALTWQLMKAAAAYESSISKHSDEMVRRLHERWLAEQKEIRLGHEALEAGWAKLLQQQT
jgi:hypothetical protein